MKQGYAPGGKSATTRQPRRRGLPGGQNMHDNLERMNETDEERRAMEDAWLARYGLLAIAALVGLAIALPIPF